VNRTLGFFVAALLALIASATAAPGPEQAVRARAVVTLVDAAAANDEPAMWRALSRVSRQRLGPSLADFRRRGARGVRASVAPFVDGSYRVVVNAAVTPRLGVVAIASSDDAFAAPVRREGAAWKVELDPAFTVEPVRPLPHERVVQRTQLAAEIVAPRPIAASAMWFDGRPFDARAYWSRDQKRMSMWGEAPQPLRNGRHTVVAFAMAGAEAAANAWTFTARGRGTDSPSRERRSP
jgi:hypothetical protein